MYGPAGKTSYRPSQVFPTQLLYGFISIWWKPSSACLVQPITVDQLCEGQINEPMKSWLCICKRKQWCTLLQGRVIITIVLCVLFVCVCVCYLVQTGTTMSHFSGTTGLQCCLWQKMPSKIHTYPARNKQTHTYTYKTRGVNRRYNTILWQLFCNELIIVTWFLTGLTAPWSRQSQLAGAGFWAGAAGFMVRYRVHWLSSGFRYVERNSCSGERKTQKERNQTFVFLKEDRFQEKLLRHTHRQEIHILFWNNTIMQANHTHTKINKRTC